jgi:hypothetical protein
MTTKVYDRKYYRYKIIDDTVNMGDGTRVGNITLHKTKWTLSDNLMHELTEMIRTPSNLNGYIQVQEFNPSTDYVYYDSIKYVNEKLNFPLYTRDQLGLMDRDELIEICRYMGIEYIHKPDKILVKFIIEKQKQNKLESLDEDKLVNKITSEYKDPNLKNVKKKKS